MASQAIRLGRPVEGIADFLPYQGEWSEREFFKYIERRGLEFTDGVVEILPMPTTLHQRLILFLLRLLLEFTDSSIPGEVLTSGVKLRIRPRKIREPDLIFVHDDHAEDFVGNRFWTGADLVVEIVSPDKPSRDYKVKRQDYAEGRVPEYWIVDPQQQTFTVLVLSKGVYTEHGVFRPGQTASSALLDGVTVDVAACFAAGVVKSRTKHRRR